MSSQANLFWLSMVVVSCYAPFPKILLRYVLDKAYIICVYDNVCNCRRIMLFVIRDREHLERQAYPGQLRKL